MKKKYVAAGVVGSIVAGAVVYKKYRASKEQNVILYPICRVTMHNDIPIYKLDKLVKKSELIIKGMVQEISEPRWNNKENKQPKNITNKDVIYKDYDILVTEVIAGDIKVEDIIKLRAYEGEVLGFTVEDNSQIVLELGQEIEGFLVRDVSHFSRDKHEDYYVPFGENQGVFIQQETKLKNINEEYEIDIFNEEVNNILAQ